MKFKLWVEATEEPEVVDTTHLTDEDQNKIGNAGEVGNGVITGYHVSDNPENLMKTFNGPKKLTATYGKKSRYAEMGPGLYLSGVPNMWMNRSNGKWDFLKTLTPDQKQALANKLMHDQVFVGKKYKDNDGSEKIYNYISQHEKEMGFRDIKNWLDSGFDGMLVGLAGQPFNIRFWEPEYLRDLGIKPGQPPKIVKVTVSGKFVNMKSHIFDWPYISKMIRAGYDGGFNPGGYTGNPEMCVWRKEAIKNIEVN